MEHNIKNGLEVAVKYALIKEIRKELDSYQITIALSKSIFKDHV